LRALITLVRTKLFICIEAGALAWNYTDTFVEALHLAGEYPSKFVNLQINDSRNDSFPSTIHTGVSDISKIGQFVQWNGLRELHTWPNGNGANDIRGTEGFFFRPNLKKGDNLTAFVDDIQRSIDLVYKATVSPLGLTGFRYGIDNCTFESAFTNPENARWGSWCPDGMFYLGPTQLKEIPVFGSKPHFLDGDPLLLDSVVGLKPDRAKHDTVIDVEPNTGANLNFARQLQINVQVNRTKERNALEFPMTELTKVVGYNKSTVLYYPVVYINEVTNTRTVKL
jgi:lysosome membrane protein 2